MFTNLFLNFSHYALTTILSTFLATFANVIARPVTEYISGKGYFDFNIKDILNQYCEDLTEKAVNNELMKTVGRDNEIELVINTLMRNGKGNPCIIGEAGVGKTALVEGLAYKIAKGDVPDEFKNIRIIKVNMVNLIAGNSYEESSTGAIRRIRALFNNVKKNPNMILFVDEFHQIINFGAAELFKTYLDRGEVKIIATTTVTEYSVLARDPALERRFTKIMIDEPSKEITLKILEKFCLEAKKKYNIIISSKVIKATVDLSEKYMMTRNFPDKALDVMRTAIAIVSTKHGKSITEDDIRFVITNETEIPITKLTKEEIEKLSKAESELKKIIVGQDDAIKKVFAKVRETRTNAGNLCSKKNILLVGTPGIGKSLLAKEIGKFVGNQIYIDMSKYFNEKAVYDLLGAKMQGYLGELIDQISKKPYSVIIFENIENAHINVLNVLGNIFENGYVSNLSGNKVDFSHAIIIMTTNIGTNTLLFKKDNVEEKVHNEIKETFGDNFFNKIDDIIILKKLTLEDLKNIAKNELKKLTSSLLKYNLINFKFDDALINHLAELSYEKKAGARKVLKLIKEEVEQPIIEAIFNQTTKSKKTINCTIDFGEIKFKIE